MGQDSHRITAEIAHVLFMDLVGYSRLSMEEQARFARYLRDTVRNTPEFQRGESRGDLISLDTGDGMALVFFRDPIAPIECAIEIARALKSGPELRLRMGVHSGPVSRVPDINGKDNVSGSGINIAQRVMDCGDEGHILLSQRYAEDLMQFETWASHLHDLGECEVKHGVRLHLFNFYNGSEGKLTLPSRLADCAPTPAVISTRVVPASASGSVEAQAGQVALLYKRGAHPDERLLHLLETELPKAGFKVFIDRHLSIGVEWATEIDKQICASEAIIPLLSATSIHSEMLDYEIHRGHKAAQEQGGKPRILPVRVAFEGELSESLAAILQPLHYFLWKNEEDDPHLVEEIIASLRNPQPAKQGLTREKLEPVGGAVPLNSRYYVVRPTDEEFRTAITRRDSIVLVKGARQMGKTSLLARGLQQAREQGARVVLTDFQTLNSSHLETAESLFLSLAEMLAEQLDLDVLPQEVWTPGRGPNMNLERYLRREVFGKITEPIVWGLDEVDRLFTCEYGSEVFGLFRSWHNKRALDPNGPWSRLTLAIAYATEAHLFISDLNQSPFNVGTRLALEDFTTAQVAELNRRYESPLQDPEEIARFHHLLGGQPYLVRRGLDELTVYPMGMDAFEAQAVRDDGLFGDHLRRILVTLSQDPALMEAIRVLLRSQRQNEPAVIAAPDFYRLRSTGILAGDSPSTARPRCQLYTTYLSRHLL